MAVDRKNHYVKSCIDNLESTIEYVQQYSNNKDVHLNVLRNLAKEYCEIDKEYLRIQEACNDTEKYFDNQENDYTEDVQNVFDKCLSEQPSTFSYTAHPIWNRIEKCITRKSDERQNNNEISDEDIEIEEEEEGIVPSQFKPPVDPITKKEVEDPCKNKKCGHIYEYATIMDHLKKIKHNKVKPRCPYIGCTNENMQSTFMVRDKALKEQIQSYMTADSSSNPTGTSICDDDDAVVL